jgi:hypothetical protein
MEPHSRGPRPRSTDGRSNVALRGGASFVGSPRRRGNADRAGAGFGAGNVEAKAVSAGASNVDFVLLQVSDSVALTAQ